MDGQPEPVRAARGERVRGAGAWFLRWVAASAATSAALVALTLLRGGRVTRTAVACRGSPDLNLKTIALVAGAFCAAGVLAWWGFGARTARARVAAGLAAALCSC